MCNILSECMQLFSIVVSSSSVLNYAVIQPPLPCHAGEPALLEVEDLICCIMYGFLHTATIPEQQNLQIHPRHSYNEPHAT